MWGEFVVGSRPCSERFFSGYSGFPLSSKNQHLQIPIRSSVPPISSALVHGYKIEIIIKLFDFMSVYTKKWNVSLMTAYCLKNNTTNKFNNDDEANRLFYVYSDILQIFPEKHHVRVKNIFCYFYLKALHQ